MRREELVSLLQMTNVTDGFEAKDLTSNVLTTCAVTRTRASTSTTPPPPEDRTRQNEKTLIVELPRPQPRWTLPGIKRERVDATKRQLQINPGLSPGRPVPVLSYFEDADVEDVFTDLLVLEPRRCYTYKYVVSSCRECHNVRCGIFTYLFHTHLEESLNTTTQTIASITFINVMWCVFIVF